MSNRLSIPKLSSNDSTASLKAYLKSIESIDVSNEDPHQYVRSIENLAPFPPHFSPKNTIKNDASRLLCFRFSSESSSCLKNKKTSELCILNIAYSLLAFWHN